MTPGTTQKRTVNVRWLLWSRQDDLDQVVAIEKATFVHPWSKEEFVGCLRQRTCVGMIADLNGKILGYMVYEHLTEGIELINFAVAPAYRRQNVGSQLITKLVSVLSAYRSGIIVAEVLETNLSAQLFFRAQGFKATHILHAYCEATGEDVYVMEYRLLPP